MSQSDLYGKKAPSNQHSSAEDSHVSPTALQENVKRLAMSVISGQNCGELFAKLNPDGSWVKTSQDSVQVRMDGSLVEYCETWPRWGILLGGVAGKLQMSERRTTENGSLLLPTPTKSDSEGGIPPNNGKYRVQKDGTKWGLKLNQKIAMIPTLTKADAHGHGYQKQKNGSKTLTIAGLLPTCTSRDHKDCGNMENVPVNSLLGRELGKNHGLKLQPAFAEWMMGFPQEWTALSASEMQLYLPKRSPSYRSSRKLKGVKSDGK